MSMIRHKPFLSNGRDAGSDGKCSIALGAVTEFCHRTASLGVRYSTRLILRDPEVEDD
jgi:hypothetical protein